MHWFTFRKKLFESFEIETKKIRPLYDGDRGISDLNATDAQLRVWIPEPLKLAIREVSDYSDSTISTYLRDFFIVYLYGAHELICMLENRTGIFYVPPTSNSEDGEDYISFSRSRSIEFIPGLGKNIIPLKIFLNIKIKDDLQSSADKAGIPLSQFVREILVSHFLGHTVWGEREQLFSLDQQLLANKWESGEELTEFYMPDNQEDPQLEGVVEKIQL